MKKSDNIFVFRSSTAPPRSTNKPVKPAFAVPHFRVRPNPVENPINAHLEDSSSLDQSNATPHLEEKLQRRLQSTAKKIELKELAIQEQERDIAERERFLLGLERDLTHNEPLELEGQAMDATHPPVNALGSDGRCKSQGVVSRLIREDFPRNRDRWQSRLGPNSENEISHQQNKKGCFDNRNLIVTVFNQECRGIDAINQERLESVFIQQERLESGAINQERHESGSINQECSESGAINQECSKSGAINQEHPESVFIEQERLESSAINHERHVSGTINQERHESVSISQERHELCSGVKQVMGGGQEPNQNSKNYECILSHLYPNIDYKVRKI